MKKHLHFAVVLTGLTTAGFAQSAGSLDLNFDSDGKVTIQPQNGENIGNSVDIGAADKILIGGLMRSSADLSGSVNYGGILRLNTDGSLDNSFGGNSTGTTTRNKAANAMSLLQPSSGRLILVGGNLNTHVSYAYTTGGANDGTFNPFNSSMTNNNEFANGAAMSSSGQFATVGYDAVSGGNYMQTIVYNSNGTPNTSFSSDGNVTNLHPGFTDAMAHDAAFQPDGKIVVAGYAQSASAGYVFGLIRYDASGNLDPAFGNNGFVNNNSNFGNEEVCQAIKIQNDGKIIAVGYAKDASDNNLNKVALARYNADGTLDVSFGSNGWSFPPVLSGRMVAREVAIQADGKYVLACEGTSSTGLNYFVVVRVNYDGTIDTGFGNNGVVSVSFPNANEAGANDVTIQSDNKIVAVGYAIINGVKNIAAVRINPGTVTNVKELPQVSTEFSAYPNPVMDKLYLRNINPGVITITNIRGEAVLQTKVDATATINIADLPAGIYFVYDNNCKAVARFIKDL